MYNPMSSLPFILIIFNHGTCGRTMYHLTDGTDLIRDISAVASLPSPRHTHIARSLGHDL
jgi:hypothetical protein